MLEACRTCLTLIDVDNLLFYEIEADDKELSKESCRYKLLSIVPEMELNITPKSMICAECHRSLEALFEFKAKCLKTEDIIMQYLEAKPDAEMKSFDLKDVSTFNGVDIKNPEDVAVNAFDEIVAIKEEVEWSDISKESVAVNEDVAVDAFVDIVAVKEEVEPSDISKETVAVNESITIVKHEVDNYFSESVQSVDPENKVLKSSKELMEGKFKCSICLKSFKSTYVLRRHMVIHTGKQLHRCDICDKTFLDKFQLKIHIRSHTGERPFECETCQKKFKARSSLNEHKKKHSASVKNFECKYCDKSYFYWSEMKRHITRHTYVTNHSEKNTL